MRCVRDHIPLEQGLRLAMLSGMTDEQLVRDHIPLEQGLRPLGYGLKSEIKSSETIFH